jgi:hypothetical protein
MEEEMRVFLLGYCTHILTDVIWTDTVWRDYISRVTGICPESDFKILYYRETDYIDFKLYREAVPDTACLRMAAILLITFYPRCIKNIEKLLNGILRIISIT